MPTVFVLWQLVYLSDIHAEKTKEKNAPWFFLTPDYEFPGYRHRCWTLSPQSRIQNTSTDSLWAGSGLCPDHITGQKMNVLGLTKTTIKVKRTQHRTCQNLPFTLVCCHYQNNHTEGNPLLRDDNSTNSVMGPTIMHPWIWCSIQHQTVWEIREKDPKHS